MTAGSQSASAGPDEGLIVTPHPLATQAGLDVLKSGGTAAEAIVTAGAVLTVVCPHFCGLGGDGVWMLADGDGRRHSILGFGQAAAAAPNPGTDLPTRGGGAALTTAGLVAGWHDMLAWQAKAWGGTCDAAALLAPAETLARDGYEVSAQQIFWTDFRREDFDHWPDLARIFLDAGETPHRHHLLRQPELAETIATLRNDGLRAFYTGPLAARLAEGLSAAGSPLTAQDLAQTKATSDAPLNLRLGEIELFAPPPPTQGVTTLTIMGILAQFDTFRHLSDSERLHLQIEAVKQAFLHRDGIADPRFGSRVTQAPSARELSDMAAAIQTDRARPWGEDYRTGDTVYLAATDRAGRHVSALQSTYFDWGAGIVAGDTGVVWNNRGAAFSSDPDSPNGIQPGKRPFHTLNPGIALWPDGKALLYGTQGADGQPQTLAVLLSEVLFCNQSVEAALRAPRFLLGRTFSDQTLSLKVERNLGKNALAQLANLGHQLADLPPLSPLAGQAGLILVQADQTKSGTHDPRGDGTAAGG